MNPLWQIFFRWVGSTTTCWWKKSWTSWGKGSLSPIFTMFYISQVVSWISCCWAVGLAGVGGCLFAAGPPGEFEKISLNLLESLRLLTNCPEPAKNTWEFRKTDQLSRWFLMILLAFPGLVRYIISLSLFWMVSFMISSLRTSSLKFTNEVVVDMIRQRCSTLYRRMIMNGLNFQRGKWIVSWIVREPKFFFTSATRWFFEAKDSEKSMKIPLKTKMAPEEWPIFSKGNHLHQTSIFRYQQLVLRSVQSKGLEKKGWHVEYNLVESAIFRHLPTMTPTIYAKFVPWQDLGTNSFPTFWRAKTSLMDWWIHLKEFFDGFIYFLQSSHGLSLSSHTCSHVCWVWEYYIRRNEEDPGAGLGS